MRWILTFGSKLFLSAYWSTAGFLRAPSLSWQQRDRSPDAPAHRKGFRLPALLRHPLYNSKRFGRHSI